MFNPEKLLGGLIRSTTRGSSAGSLLKSGAAVGLLGVALEAVEHYMDAQQQSSGMKPDPPPQAPSLPRDAMPPDTSTTAGPPPPPGPSPPPPPPPGARNAEDGKSVLLIRAMIAAANADGQVDAIERQRILKKLKSAGLSSEEQAFIDQELLKPPSLEDIVRQIDDRQMAIQVYAVSLLAIEVDTEAERRYQQRLSQKLGLDPDTIQSIHTKLGLKAPVDPKA